MTWASANAGGALPAIGAAVRVLDDAVGVLRTANDARAALQAQVDAGLGLAGDASGLLSSLKTAVASTLLDIPNVGVYGIVLPPSQAKTPSDAEVRRTLYLAGVDPESPAAAAALSALSRTGGVESLIRTLLDALQDPGDPNKPIVTPSTCVGYVLLVGGSSHLSDALRGSSGLSRALGNPQDGSRSALPRPQGLQAFLTAHEMALRWSAPAAATPVHPYGVDATVRGQYLIGFDTPEAFQDAQNFIYTFGLRAGEVLSRKSGNAKVLRELDAQSTECRIAQKDLGAFGGLALLWDLRLAGAPPGGSALRSLSALCTPRTGTAPPQGWPPDFWALRGGSLIPSVTAAVDRAVGVLGLADSGQRKAVDSLKSLSSKTRGLVQRGLDDAAAAIASLKEAVAVVQLLGGLGVTAQAVDRGLEGLTLALGQVATEPSAPVLPPGGWAYGAAILLTAPRLADVQAAVDAVSAFIGASRPKEGASPDARLRPPPVAMPTADAGFNPASSTSTDPDRALVSNAPGRVLPVRGADLLEVASPDAPTPDDGFKGIQKTSTC